MSANLRHHYVPQFYLRRFASDSNLRRTNVYHIPSNKIINHASIRDQAQVHKLYKTKDVEQCFQQMESRFSIMLSKIADSGVAPPLGSSLHYELLANIALQHARTPSAGESVMAGLQLQLDALVDSTPKWKEKGRLVVKGGDPIGFALIQSLVCHPLLDDLCIKVIHSLGKRDFITSDNPVVFYNMFTERTRSIFSGSGITSIGLQIWYPISPKICILLYDPITYKVGGKRTSITSLHAREREVDEINSLQFASAHQLLFISDINRVGHIADIQKRANSSHASGNQMYEYFSSTPSSKGGNDTVDFIRLKGNEIKIDLKLPFISLTRYRSNSQGNIAQITTRNPDRANYFHWLISKAMSLEVDHTRILTDEYNRELVAQYREYLKEQRHHTSVMPPNQFWKI